MDDDDDDDDATVPSGFVGTTVTETHPSGRSQSNKRVGVEGDDDDDDDDGRRMGDTRFRGTQPRLTSSQPFGLAAALNSNGVRT
jgi:hypothetical protein